ncbi:hypothetical protein Tco_0956555 [Tanacetum coccineum]
MRHDIVDPYTVERRINNNYRAKEQLSKAKDQNSNTDPEGQTIGKRRILYKYTIAPQQRAEGKLLMAPLLSSGTIHGSGLLPSNLSLAGCSCWILLESAPSKIGVS